MIKIRKSNSKDISIIAKIWRDSVLATHDFLNPMDFKKIELMVCNDYLPNTDLWVADEDNCPVAFMGMTGNHIDSLFITPDMRGKGIGKLMIAHALQLFDNQITVDVNEQNIQATGFYNRMGFVLIGRTDVDDQGRPYPILKLKFNK